MTSSQPQGRCASCGVDATKKCSACIEGVDVEGKVIEPTYYCSSSCQATHWDSHNKSCWQTQRRKQLYREGELLQGAFYVYRSHSLPHSVVRVEKNGNDLNFSFSEQESEKMLYDLPYSVVSNFEDRKTILAKGAVPDALVAFKDILLLALDGVNIAIQDVTVLAKEGPRKIKNLSDVTSQIISSFNFQWRHELYQVQLKGGEVYAFDITAAAFGWKDTVVPWERYLSERVSQGRSIFRVGLQEAKLDLYMAELAEIHGEHGFNNQVPSNIILAQEWLYPVIEKTLSAWLEQENLATLQAVLNFPKTTYREKAASFTATLDKAIMEKLRRAEGQGGVVKVASLEGTRQNMIDRCMAWHEGDEEGAEASVRKVNIWV